jgi:hypothetical protein
MEPFARKAQSPCCLSPQFFAIRDHIATPSMSRISKESGAASSKESLPCESWSSPIHSSQRLTYPAFHKDLVSGLQALADRLGTTSTVDVDKTTTPATPTPSSTEEESSEFLALCKRYQDSLLTDPEKETSQVVPASFHEGRCSYSIKEDGRGWSIIPHNTRPAVYDRKNKVLITEFAGQMIKFNTATADGTVWSASETLEDVTVQEFIIGGVDVLVEGPPSFCRGSWVVCIPPREPVQTGSCTTCRSAL